MIDSKKRSTLKKITAVTGVGLTAGSGSILAAELSASLNTPKSSSSSVEIEVTTQVSALTNDLEVVITNVTPKTLTFNQMTPSVTRVARGEFNFAGVVGNSGFELSPGQRVTVPLEQQSISLAGQSGIEQHADIAAGSLLGGLRKSLTLRKSDGSFANILV